MIECAGQVAVNSRIAPTLILGYGNPSRGDDALAPLLLEALSDAAARTANNVELMTDFQLQIEHVLDLEGRTRVVFVDATQTGVEPYRFETIEATPEPCLSTHSLLPGALLAVYRNHFGMDAPPSRVLAIRGYSFELGDGLSAAARCNLDAAHAMLTFWLNCPASPHSPVRILPVAQFARD